MKDLNVVQEKPAGVEPQSGGQLEREKELPCSSLGPLKRWKRKWTLTLSLLFATHSLTARSNVARGFFCLVDLCIKFACFWPFYKAAVGKEIGEVLCFFAWCWVIVRVRNRVVRVCENLLISLFRSAWTGEGERENNSKFTDPNHPISDSGDTVVIFSLLCHRWWSVQKF